MILVYKTIDQVKSLVEVAAEYQFLLGQLYGDSVECTADDLIELQKRFSSELLLLVYDNNKLVASAHATYTSRPPYPKVYVNSVITDVACRGQGIGTALMQALHCQCIKRWPKTTAFHLTSSPKRNTQGYYQTLGYQMRTKENGNETIVYEMHI